MDNQIIIKILNKIICINPSITIRSKMILQMIKWRIIIFNNRLETIIMLMLYQLIIKQFYNQYQFILIIKK